MRSAPITLKFLGLLAKGNACNFLIGCQETGKHMDMNKKMVADTLIVIGIILVVVGWSGRSVGGIGAVVAYVLMGFGLVLGGIGLVRYTRLN